MLSMPPATTTAPLPARARRCASITAFIPEPHILLSVVAGTSSGRPGGEARLPRRRLALARRQHAAHQQLVDLRRARSPRAPAPPRSRRPPSSGAERRRQRPLEAAHRRAGGGDDDDGVARNRSWNLTPYRAALPCGPAAPERRRGRPQAAPPVRYPQARYSGSPAIVATSSARVKPSARAASSQRARISRPTPRRAKAGGCTSPAPGPPRAPGRAAPGRARA